MIFNCFTSRWASEYLPFPLALQKIESIQLEAFKTGKIKYLSEKDIDLFIQYFKKGRYSKMYKCATAYQITIKHRHGTAIYYLHGGAIGSEPGGLIQVVFTPKNKQLREFIDSIMKESTA